jgi:hypothetical protein
MPKAKLEFDLPDEQDEFWLATSAPALYRALWNIQYEILRSEYKYGNHTGKAAKLIESIYKRAWEEIGDLLEHVI